MADFVLQWLKANGFGSSYQQQVSEGRNTIGVLRGSGAGKSLIFNSHMDSEQGMTMRIDEEPPPGPTASVDHEKKRIFGLAVQNDRGPMAAFMIAAKAIQEQRPSFIRRYH
jgi:acetylornithine deacetylase/succinyl-diaminopimelate desuccinylase-like protein